MEGSYPTLIVAATQTSSRETRSSTSFGEMLASPIPSKRIAPISIDSDSDGEKPQKTSPASRQRTKLKRPHPSTQTTPQKAVRLSEIPQFKTTKSQRKQFELDEIRGIREDHYVGLPGETDPKATEKMIKLSIAHWEDPVTQFISRTGDLCGNMIYERVQSVFGHRKNTKFHSDVTDICRTFLTNAMDDQLKLVKRMLSWELRKPKTLNEAAINVAKDNAIEYLQMKRRECLARAWIDLEEEKTGKPTTGAARMDKIAKVTEAQLGPDPYSLEIKAMGVSSSGSSTVALLIDRKSPYEPTMSVPFLDSWTMCVLVFTASSL